MSEAENIMVINEMATSIWKIIISDSIKPAIPKAKNILQLLSL